MSRCEGCGDKACEGDCFGMVNVREIDTWRKRAEEAEAKLKAAIDQKWWGGSVVTELEQDRDRLSRKLAETEEFYWLYQNAVDEVFQYIPGKPRPILDGFVGAGQCKAKGIVRLAKAYAIAVKALGEIAEPTGMGPHRPSEVRLKDTARRAIESIKGET